MVRASVGLIPGHDRAKSFNLLLDDNFLHWTKFKAVADDKLNAAVIKIAVFYRVENNVGIGENAFLTFSTMFLKAIFSRDFKNCEIKS